MRIRYTEAALAEIDSIFFHIASDDAAAAARVVARIEQVAARLVEFPHIGHTVDEPGVRILPLGRYPYLVFYTVAAQEVVVIHVRHAARQRP